MRKFFEMVKNYMKRIFREVLGRLRLQKVESGIGGEGRMTTVEKPDSSTSAEIWGTEHNCSS